MTNDGDFLPEILPRSWSLDSKHGFQPMALFIGKGTNTIEECERLKAVEEAIQSNIGVRKEG